MATFEYNGEVMARALLSHHLEAALALAVSAGVFTSVESVALKTLAATAKAGIQPAWAVVPEEPATPPPSNPFHRGAGNGSKPPVRRAEAAEILGVSLKTLDKFMQRRVLKALRRDKRGFLFDPDYLKGIDARALMLRKPRQ